MNWRIIEQPNCGHAVWPFAYGNVKVWDWMFAQQRGQPAVPPATQEAPAKASDTAAQGR